MATLQSIKTDTYDFAVIRKSDSLYIDKTQYLVKLFKQNTRVFFSRPRRFGKSLMLAVFENLYLGKRDLFKGLAIEKQLDEPIFQPHPVIFLDMSGLPTEDGIEIFDASLIKKVVAIAKSYNVSVDTLSSACAFSDLMSMVANKYAKPVILIDEYDCPLVDTYDDVTIKRKYVNCFAVSIDR
jgi:hypothetical protein